MFCLNMLCVDGYVIMIVVRFFECCLVFVFRLVMLMLFCVL